MACKERLETYLRENGVPYQEQKHREVFTAQKVAAAEHVPGRMVAKVVMVKADGKLAMLVLPAPYLVDLAKASQALGVEQVELAREQEFAAVFPDCEVGSEPPFGNLYGLPVWVDQDLAKDETIVVEAGTYTDTLTLRYVDYERLAQPTVADLARRR